MLHDLYLLSVYFDPTQAVLYEDDLNNRYGRDAVDKALGQGLIERFCAPCASGRMRFFCRLSDQGRNFAQVSIAI
jgi:hypothetical protein